MKKLGKSEHLLDMIKQPAFTVIHGKVHHTNHGAKGLHIEEGTLIQELIPTNWDEYEQFESGCLYLTIHVLNTDFGASVSKNGKTDIFILDDPTSANHLTSVAVSGQQLRSPLTNILSLLDTYFPTKSSQNADEAFVISQLKHNLMQMLRMTGNMCDSHNWIEKAASKQTHNICAVFSDQIQKCCDKLESTSAWIRCKCPSEPIYTQMNIDMITRAILNMVSNAVKYSTPNPLIIAELTQTDNKIRICITNPATETEHDMLTNAFTHYMRQPMLEDTRFGIGLGMTLIRSAAIAHGGTVLIDQSDPNSIRVTMTMRIDPPETCNQLRAPTTRLSNYAGDLDLVLLELSDILPPTCYDIDF